MKFLVDVCLSPGVARGLTELGHDAVHWSVIGPVNAKDSAIMAWCLDNDHVIITADMDFAHLLAKARNDRPSVIMLRTAVHAKEVVVPLLHSAIEHFSLELAEGCLIAVEETKARVRRLPIE
jgi:predicted nuclease of predicted toxin-antitoxin system